jgi:hypothetical protein
MMWARTAPRAWLMPPLVHPARRTRRGRNAAPNVQPNRASLPRLTEQAGIGALPPIGRRSGRVGITAPQPSTLPRRDGPSGAVRASGSARQDRAGRDRGARGLSGADQADWSSATRKMRRHRRALDRHRIPLARFSYPHDRLPTYPIKPCDRRYSEATSQGCKDGLSHPVR